ncbi:MAG: hypothetical protein ABI410_11845 [Rhodoferax sp.]|uniref:hypothetical protein n=1 Tax=Rhodoferax sp. TaxID=50421 RepID=UPI00326327D5
MYKKLSRQHSQRRARYWVAIASLIAIVCSHAAVQAGTSVPAIRAGTGSTKEKTMATPDTAPELWSRIMALLQKNKGYTSKKDVEKALGIRFNRSWHDPEWERGWSHPTTDLTHEFHKADTELGLQKVTLWEGSRRTQLILEWKYPSPPDPSVMTIGPRLTPQCMQFLSARKDLNAIGWSGGEIVLRSGPYPESVGFNLTEETSAVVEARHKDFEWPIADTTFGRSTISMQAAMPQFGYPCFNWISIDAWRQP